MSNKTTGRPAPAGAANPRSWTRRQAAFALTAGGLSWMSGAGARAQTAPLPPSEALLAEIGEARYAAVMTAFETNEVSPGASVFALNFEAQSDVDVAQLNTFEDTVSAILSRYDPIIEQLLWPDRSEAPDYRHFDSAGGVGSFAVNHETLSVAAARTGFEFDGDAVIVALRGARLAPGLADVARLRTPDFFDFRCLLGLWRRETQSVTFIPASTVPSAPHIAAQRTLRNAAKLAHLTPTGLHPLRPGEWRAGRRRPQTRALMFTRSFATLRPFGRPPGARAFNIRERWDLSADSFGDGVFAGQLEEAPFKGARFASGGGVAGRGVTGLNGAPSGAFAAFRQEVREATQSLGADDEMPLMLLTGQDIQQAFSETNPGRADLKRLRLGSTGPAVGKLQAALGVLASGVFDAGTQVAVLTAQLTAERAADGVVTPKFYRDTVGEAL